MTELLREIERKDARLAADLANEYKTLSERRAFGLNFERHVPETVDLPGRPIRRGDKVRFLPMRGASAGTIDKRLWRVASIAGTDHARVANLVRQASPDGGLETATRPLDALVVVAEFRDPVYPGLVSAGRVKRGGDKPFHTVINAENFHALQALLYTHEGKVDAIYVDPPYNSGARDWKYNNDYVDGEDLYRHSKWLAFMERRLVLAKKLLNSEDSVLIVTIDEREIHRLGLLIEQVFPEAKTQMVTITINHRGVARNREFTRVEEYAFFVFFGSAGPAQTNDDLLTGQPDDTDGDEPVRWERLIKGSNEARRQDRPNLFYPVYIDPVNKRIVKIGAALPPDVPRDSVKIPGGLVAVWPLARNGSEKRWQLAPETLTNLVAQGIAKVGAYDKRNDHWSILYLNRGQLERIDRGEIAVTGKDANGVLTLEQVSRPKRAGMTVWNRTRHNAGYYGSGMLTALIPGRKFPFPKSLYAVEDTLRFAVANKPSAIVLDFFAGSGTTAHAVMRLNRQDNGRRQCISVTNNEVSPNEQAALDVRGLRPGDAEWEAFGICDHITEPRLRAAVTGRTPEDQPVRGDYKFIDEFPMSEGFEENVEFFRMTYEAPRAVAHNRAFEAIAPLLWLRAGSQGRRIDTAADDFAVADTYGVLFDLDASAAFVEALQKAESVRVAFIVTDDEYGYQMVCTELPAYVKSVRIYESYLTNFAINTARE
ncbi:MAG: site-specific DNA-methyltransferase [Streptosporangiaceae bacterium]|nr:site-specific DNA-methyltransferase [Streptosporangiaceae bacterium]